MYCPLSASGFHLSLFGMETREEWFSAYQGGRFGRAHSRGVGTNLIVNESTLAKVSSIVIVHGLASDPFTTWSPRKAKQSPETSSELAKSPESESWVADWLPQELERRRLRSRIMIFKHNSAWTANSLSKSLEDHGDDLIQALELERTSAEVRHQTQTIQCND